MKNILLLSVLVFWFGCTSNPRVVIKTNMGEIEIELAADAAPKHTENFVKLVEERFYIGTSFHRIKPGFVVQGGDPNSKDKDRSNDGLGGPGYQIEAEIGLPHLKGSVAAARQGDRQNPQKKSSGSQFYICLEDLPQLDGKYTVFGKVIRGMDVVTKMAAVKRDPRDNPVRSIIMEQMYIN